MQDRRGFLKRAGLLGVLGAVGVLSVKKKYVKPVVGLLEPGVVYAQTPALVVTSALWDPALVDPAVAFPATSMLTITLDVPGASPPASDETLNAAVSITNVSEAAGAWGTGGDLEPPLPQGSTMTSAEMNDIAVVGSSGTVTFDLDLDSKTVNGVRIPDWPDDVPLAMREFLYKGLTGDRVSVCLHVTADEGVTTDGNTYPAQALGVSCVDAQFS